MLLDFIPTPAIYYEEDSGGNESGGEEGRSKEGNESSGEEGKSKEGDPGPVPYDRFKEVNEERRKLEVRLAKLEAEEKRRAEESAKEQGKFEELYNSTKAELEAERLRAARSRIALELGLPAVFVDRLMGSNEDEITEDAKKLLELVKESESAGGSKGIPGKTRGGEASRLDIANMSPEEIRKNKEKLMQQIRG